MLKTGAGEPFKTMAAAKSAAATKGFREDEYKVVEFGGGYACQRIGFGDDDEGRESGLASAPSRTAAAAAMPRETETGYRKVKFHPRSSMHEPADVVLSLNGNVLLIQRGVMTILPTPYLEVARHTKYRTFRQDPSNMRKSVVEISQYPYEDLGPATRDEYLALLNKGTAETRKKMERSGDLPENPYGEEDR